MSSPESLPIVRLELSSMRYQVLHAFHEHQLQLDMAVQAALDQAIKEFNIGTFVKVEVSRILAARLQSAIHNACTTIMQDPKITFSLQAILHKALAKQLSALGKEEGV